MSLIIEKGFNDTVVSTDGREFVDLLSGFGSAILGHANPAVSEALKHQADLIWNVGNQQHNLQESTKAEISSFLPGHYYCHGLYSTGMEAIEFTFRIASIITGKHRFLGFNRSMHGKSVASSSLTWGNIFNHADFNHIPFVDELPEERILDLLEKSVATNEIAALYIEPIQGSAGGLEGSGGFYRDMIEICRRHNVLTVGDEILTGFYRSGNVSYLTARHLYPDILVFGKCLGNGFPVSAVTIDKKFQVTDRMLPGSTYSDNPLACSVIKACLKEFSRLDMGTRVPNLENIIRSGLGSADMLKIRGRGLLWFLEFENSRIAREIYEEALENAILCSLSGRYIRILPAATISEKRLKSALETLSELIRKCLYQSKRTAS